MINPSKKQISDTRTAPLPDPPSDRPRDPNINMGVMPDAATLTADSARNMSPKTGAGPGLRSEYMYKRTHFLSKIFAKKSLSPLLNTS